MQRNYRLQNRVFSILSFTFWLLTFVVSVHAQQAVQAQTGPTQRALIVGIDRYKDRALAAWEYAERDAKLLEGELSGLGYRTTLLLGPHATKVAIETALKEMAKASAAGDRLLVAFAGHGFQADGIFTSGGLIPFDAKSDIPSEHIALSTLFKTLSGAPAAERIVLVDAARHTHLGLRGITPPAGIAALYSCGPKQQAYESASLGHGLFFHAVLEGLRGAAADNAGLITFNELTRKVIENVGKEALTLGQDFSQKPVSASKPEVNPTVAKTDPMFAKGKVIRVSATDPTADFRTIQGAILRAPEYARIVVLPGVYRENLFLLKPVMITGRGSKQNIVIESSAESALRAAAPQAYVTGVTIRVVSSGAEREELKFLHAVTADKGQAIFLDCDITGNSGECVHVENKTLVTLRHCNIHHGGSDGVWAAGFAEVRMEHCDILGHARSGIEVDKNSKFAARRCVIHSNDSHGISVKYGSQATLDDCELYGNLSTQASVYGMLAKATLQNCTLRDGTSSGAAVFENAELVLEDCLVTGNAEIGLKAGKNALGFRAIRTQVHGNRGEGIEFQEGSAGTVEGCNVHENVKGGIVVGIKAKPTFLKCQVHNNAGTGIFFSKDSEGAVEECHVFANSQFGITADQSGLVKLRACRVIDNKKSGIYVKNGGRINAEECSILGNIKSGVEIAGKSSGTLLKCQLKDGKSDGVFAYEGASVSLVDCTVLEHAGAGIAMQEAAALSIKGCRIQKNVKSGVSLITQSNGTVEDCQIDGNGGIGVFVQSKATATLRRTRIHENKSVGLLFDEKATGLVEGCDVFGNGKSGVIVSVGANPTLRGSKFRDNKQSGAFIYEAGKGEFIDCDFIGNATVGLQVQEQADPTLRKCRIQKNTIVGVWIKSDGAATVEDCDLTDNGKKGPFDVETGGVLRAKGNTPEATQVTAPREN